MNLTVKIRIAELFLVLVIAFLVGCTSDDFKQNKLSEVQIEKGEDYVNIFKPLDGIWQGEFKIYIDTLGQQRGKSQPKEINYDAIEKPSLKLQSIIKARHIYKSISPFKQEGEIVNIITNKDGTTDTIKSKATNLVENGKLKCFVYKPTETVIHNGEYLGNNTIVWKRSLSNPLKIEYFKETVSDEHYKIIGWGYYGYDDPSLTPRCWFYADYIKVE